MMQIDSPGCSASTSSIPTRDAKASLGRLIRIRRRADHDRLALEQREVSVRAVAQRSAQDVGARSASRRSAARTRARAASSSRASCRSACSGFAVACALEHPAVGVARVAVGAPERAADVRIDRPEAHPRRFGPVEDARARRSRSSGCPSARRPPAAARRGRSAANSAACSSLRRQYRHLLEPEIEVRQDTEQMPKTASAITELVELARRRRPAVGARPRAKKFA